MAERQILSDPIGIGLIGHGRGPQAAPTFGAFCRQKVALARMRAEHLARRCDFKTLGYRFAGFDRFWTTHTESFDTFEKERAI
jgi:hypothetical protein